MGRALQTILNCLIWRDANHPQLPSKSMLSNTQDQALYARSYIICLVLGCMVTSINIPTLCLCWSGLGLGRKRNSATRPPKAQSTHITSQHLPPSLNTSPTIPRPLGFCSWCAQEERERKRTEEKKPSGRKSIREHVKFRETQNDWRAGRQS